MGGAFKINFLIIGGIKMKKNFNDKMAAEYLGLSVQTLRNWRCQCRGPTYLKMGRSVRYQLEDLEEYKRNRRINPNKR